MINKITLTTTRKSGELMAILKIEDEESFLEAFVFPKVFDKVRDYLQKGNIIAAQGRVSLREGSARLLISKIVKLEQVYEWVTKVDLYIEKPDQDFIGRLKNVLLGSPGKIPVFFHFQHPELKFVKVKPGKDFCIEPQENLIQELSAILGEKNLSLTLTGA